MKKRFFTMAMMLAACVRLQAALPNILYIMTDQHSANALSHVGNREVSTPNIDRLAERGVLFSNAYCALPLSGPSRAAMFTGMMPSAIGMEENGTPMPDDLRPQTLGHLMEEAGYDNGYSGKWHVNTNSLPAERAFGFENLHGHNDYGLAEDAIEFMARDHGGKPFFLVASFDNPHNICEYARGQKLPFAEIRDVPVDSCPNLPKNFLIQPYDADILRWERERSYRLYPTKGYTPDDWRHYRHAYYRLIEHVDAEVGKIVDALDSLDLWKNTVVIFTSDHGDGQGAHQWNQKTVLWEEVANIPLIVCAPGNGRHAGEVSEALVNNGIDLMPSVLDWAGASIPERCNGKSIRKAVENPKADTGHDFVVCETVFAQTGGTRGWAVRTPKYKYVLYEAGANREMLFDMETDRLEMTNLAVEAGYEPILQTHRDLLRGWMEANLPPMEYPMTRFIPTPR